MLYLKEKYRDYADSLIKKGISPTIVKVGNIIRLLTEDENAFNYDFSTKNIVSGPFGELIKVDRKQGIVEIYNSIMDDHYSLRVYDIDNGKLLPDGELYSYYSEYESKDLYGEEEYNYLLDLEKNDFYDCHRTINRDKDNLNIERLELTNKIDREKSKDLKVKLLELTKKYCNRHDRINDGIAKIISYIEEAYSVHYGTKEFTSNELDSETVEIINRQIYLDSLREESEAFSKISIIPITDIIAEYKAYNAPGTDKIVEKYINISRKISTILDTFIYNRIYVRKRLKSSEEIDQMTEKHRKLLLKRRDELDNLGGFYD